MLTYEKATSYRDNNMYVKNQGMKDLFEGTLEVYNPIPKLIVTMASLVMKGMNYQDATEGQNRILELLKASNNLDEKLETIIEYEILFDKYWLELVNDDTDEYINLIDQTMMTKVVKVGEEVRYCQFSGVDSNGVTVQKEYYWNTEGQPNRIVEKRGNEETVIPMEKMRLIERVSKYKLEPLLNKVDKVNEFKCFNYNMSKADGDPLLFLKLIPTLSEEEKEILRKAKHKNSTRTLASDDIDSLIQYIELTGQIIPHIQKEIESYKTEIIDDYPETNMAYALNSSNVSEDSLIIKISDLDAKVKTIRSLVTRVINFIFDILGGSAIILGFDPIVEESTSQKITQIRELRAEGLLDKETAIEMLAEIGFIDDAQRVIGRVKKEAKELLTGGDPYAGAFPNQNNDD